MTRTWTKIRWNHLGDGSSHVSLRFLPSSPVKGFSSLTLVEGSGQRTSHFVKASETNCVFKEAQRTRFN